MHNVTLISTNHKEYGKCNADELHKIIESICPEVIFLEALESSYTKYDYFLFSQFEVYHERLEIKAIQKYNQNHPLKYVPVLDIGLSDEFYKKLDTLCEHNEYQKLIDNGYLLTNEFGFQYVNSEKGIQLFEEMRELGNHILSNNEVCQKSDESIDTYENSMLRNIYAYCKDNLFNKAIFMCGAAHRKSIIEKIKRYKTEENLKLNWTFYGN